MTQIGAQLYTIREHTKTVADIARSMERIRDIGYEAVQISAFGPADDREVAGIMQDCGLTVAATHVSWPALIEDTAAVIDTHHTWDCRHVAIGGLPPDYRSLEGIDRFIDELRPVAATLRAEGLDFSYHNHSHELVRLGGKTLLERQSVQRTCFRGIDECEDSVCKPARHLSILLS